MDIARALTLQERARRNALASLQDLRRQRAQSAEAAALLSGSRPPAPQPRVGDQLGGQSRRDGG